ncbi:hypothetical protein GQ43DRAFT_275996 [Delitschia confertaspora ATCC 74209]|uniref:Uncharacterized protein n=1 Tax=Delitschia confertaspora ATCC 74209 TaxID=1513339 RepID=A0A9P4JQC6_9PLEO|nr:hypothetical protein GQ43DRAFT_275996 [Delitschia confertaspora ATCC 74209]
MRRAVHSVAEDRHYLGKHFCGYIPVFVAVRTKITAGEDLGLEIQRKNNNTRIPLLLITYVLPSFSWVLTSLMPDKMTAWSPSI